MYNQTNMQCYCFEGNMIKYPADHIVTLSLRWPAPGWEKARTIVEWNHLDDTIVYQKSVDSFKSALAKARSLYRRTYDSKWMISDISIQNHGACVDIFERQDTVPAETKIVCQFLLYSIPKRPHIQSDCN